jgi:hypothetical protein
VGDEEPDREELHDEEEDEVAVLPEREAMSLISPEPASSRELSDGEQSGANHVESEQPRTSQL